jgi:hypothetical protein
MFTLGEVDDVREERPTPTVLPRPFLTVSGSMPGKATPDSTLTTSMETKSGNATWELTTPTSGAPMQPALLCTVIL